MIEEVPAPAANTTTTEPEALSALNPEKVICKRRDYDFSQQGIPRFEFSQLEKKPMPFLAVHSPIPFLAVTDMPRFHYADQCFNTSREEHNELLYQACLHPDSTKNQGYIGFASPYRGLWWKEYYRRANEDAKLWVRIKDTMARGRCRVVLRFEEKINEVKEVDMETMPESYYRERAKFAMLMKRKSRLRLDQEKNTAGAIMGASSGGAGSSRSGDMLPPPARHARK